jgi:hypothetical protein
MDILELKRVLNQCYARDTAVPNSQSEWNENNRTLGHCAIVSLIVQDFFPSALIKRTLVNEKISHYFNEIDGEVFDLTAEQFCNISIPYDKAIDRTRDYLIQNDDTNKRYLLLKERVEEVILNQKSKIPLLKKL